MQAKTVKRRLMKAILATEMQASLWLEGDFRVNVGSVTIEIYGDRLFVSPGGTRLGPEQVKLLGDPDSLLWLVVRLDDAELEAKVARFLRKNGINIRADWLRPRGHHADDESRSST